MQMRKIKVVLFSDLPGGAEPYQDETVKIEFAQLDPGGWLPEMTSSTWVLVDWVPRALSGLEICRRLRCNPRTAQAHITMVLEEEDGVARRRSIASGADDCLVAPIDRTKLLSRVLGQDVPGLDQEPNAIVQHNDLVVDICAFQVRWRDKPIPMMPTQLRLLRFFMEHPGQIYTRTQLMAALGNEAPLDERTVDVWIGRLRSALKTAGAGNLLRTVRSLGYTLEWPRRTQRRGKAA
jgi:two-component system, OmpR family, phosphate regulon response regulator PhoB